MDWERLKKVSKQYSEHLLRDFPDAAKKDRLAIYYKSFDAFVADFPGSEDRDDYIEKLEEIDKEIREALESCLPILDAIQKQHELN
jgi:hypothetical protein